MAAIERRFRQVRPVGCAALVQAERRHARKTAPFFPWDAFPDFPEFLQRLGNALIVRIEADEEFAPRKPQRAVPGRRLAGILLPDVADGKIGLLLPAFDHFPRVVGRAVIDYQPLEIFERLPPQALT